VLHGHGLLARQVRGVLEVGEPAGVVVLRVRRYACQLCRAVMTVVPAGMLARRQYGGSSIAYALYLWLLTGLSDRCVRDRVCAWHVRGHSARGWVQLYRWSREATRLFALTRPVAVVGEVHDSARRVLSVLQALAPPALQSSPAAEQIFAGAALVP